MPPKPMPQWASVIAILLMAGCSRLLYSTMYDDYYDDSFITFRYAQNIVDGKGFVYNEHESVYGASSPLYTWVSVVLRSAFGSSYLPVVARWFGTLSLFACGLLIYCYVGLVPMARNIMLMILLSYPRIFYSCIGGMEECFIIFAGQERTWFESRFDSVFQTASGPAVDRFILFKSRSAADGNTRLGEQRAERLF